MQRVPSEAMASAGAALRYLAYGIGDAGETDSAE